MRTNIIVGSILLEPLYSSHFVVILRPEYPKAVLKLNFLHPLTNSSSFSSSGVVEVCDSNDYYPSVRAMVDINKMTQSRKLGTIPFDIG